MSPDTGHGCDQKHHSVAASRPKPGDPQDHLVDGQSALVEPTEVPSKPAPLRAIWANRPPAGGYSPQPVTAHLRPAHCSVAHLRASQDNSAHLRRGPVAVGPLAAVPGEVGPLACVPGIGGPLAGRPSRRRPFACVPVVGRPLAVGPFAAPATRRRPLRRPNPVVGPQVADLVAVRTVHAKASQSIRPTCGPPSPDRARCPRPICGRSSRWPPTCGQPRCRPPICGRSSRRWPTCAPPTRAPRSRLRQVRDCTIAGQRPRVGGPAAGLRGHRDPGGDRGPQVPASHAAERRPRRRHRSFGPYVEASCSGAWGSGPRPLQRPGQVDLTHAGACAWRQRGGVEGRAHSRRFTSLGARTGGLRPAQQLRRR